MIHKFRCLCDGKWEYATLDELCSNLGFDYGTPSNVISFSDGKHKTQWTGLLDKNGKEIYEGDILGWGRSGIIMFYDGAFNGHYYGSAGDIQESWEEPLRYNLKDCEVIGNIYENHELLTK